MKIFKAKRQIKIIEAHIKFLNGLIKHSEDMGCKIAASNYISQKIALEDILRDFKREGLL